MHSIHSQQGRRLPRLQHVTLSISDGAQDAIRAFYTGIIGLSEKPVPQSMASKGLLWFVAGDAEVELHFIPDAYLQNPAEGRHFCLEVDDLDSYRSTLQAAGYQITEAGPIHQRPRFFTIDPCGNRIEFVTILGDYLAAE